MEDIRPYRSEGDYEGLEAQDAGYLQYGSKNEGGNRLRQLTDRLSKGVERSLNRLLVKNEYME